MIKQCAECRDGEHDNIRVEVELVFVRDPETKKIVKRANLCDDHIECWLMDGYEVVNCATGRAI